METPSELAARLGVTRQRADQILNPEKHQARVTLGRALKAGKIVKPTLCEACGQSEQLNGHHTDYSKPLEVCWLCGPCHRREHGIWSEPKPIQPIEPITDEMLRAVMQELGRRGGKKGGKSTSDAKKQSSAANLAKARANIKKLKKKPKGKKYGS